MGELFVQCPKLGSEVGVVNITVLEKGKLLKYDLSGAADLAEREMERTEFRVWFL